MNYIYDEFREREKERIIKIFFERVLQTFLTSLAS